MAQMVSEELVENFINSVQHDKHKSEVAQVFLKFKATTEIETGYKLKTIRSDNRAEYTSAQFQALCTDAGIKHQLTNVYTPQQNGASEKRNKSLMEMARCLLFEKNMPKTLWAEVVNTAVYLQNRLPTKERNQPEATSEELVTNLDEADQIGTEMDIDDMLVRGTRPLAEIYKRAQVAIVEPTCFEEAEGQQGWKQAMLDEIKMIEKN
ncbi:Cysteine-rich RLK (RECEPTOR-like protein kinase) 8 [Gossypium australe]|uniref:Cysteine-rich RLK (RECEPTOR-like protein kinase) 8 n=1 Tax=Gossypium australe TaxID=47621 RepID=A0A5B6VTF6_9ROSI|nr:Cysteine-rich RLK (RECEPTOR-like protein kinase) 8 [Gossypium australe]